VFEGFAIN